MMNWFGKRYRAPVYRDVERTATPLGAACAHCGEVIVDGDDGFVIPALLRYPEVPAGATADTMNVLHRACFLRTVVGSVAHVQRLCSCYVPGASEGDPEGLTTREAAVAAVREYEKYERVPLLDPEVNDSPIHPMG